MSNENINKHGVDLSKLILGKSVIKFYYDKEKAIYTGAYLGPEEDGWLRVQCGNLEWIIHPDEVLTLSDPDPRF